MCNLRNLKVIAGSLNLRKLMDKAYGNIRRRKTFPENELEDVYKALVLGAKDYIKKNNFPGVLIGSLQGIDSALTATIASDAIGPNRVKLI